MKGCRFAVLDRNGHVITLTTTEVSTTAEMIKQVLCDLSPAEVKLLNEEEYQTLLRE